MLNEHAIVTENTAEFAQFSCQKKRLESIVALLDFVHKNGIDHEGLGDVMDAQDHFMGMAPAATLQWPKKLMLHRATHRVRKATGPSEFWSQVPKVVKLFPDAQQANKLSNLIAEKVVGLTRGDSVLLALRSFFQRDAAFDSFPAVVSTQLSDLADIAWFDSCTAGDLEAHCKRLGMAIKQTRKQKDAQITSAITTLPSGRSLVDDAIAFEKKGLNTVEQVTVITNFVTDGIANLAALDATPSEAFRIVDSMQAIDGAAKQSTSPVILQEHFVALTHESISNFVYSVASHCLSGFRVILYPLLIGQTEWDAWAQVGQFQCPRC